MYIHICIDVDSIKLNTPNNIFRQQASFVKTKAVEKFSSKTYNFKLRKTKTKIAIFIPSVGPKFIKIK